MTKKEKTQVELLRTSGYTYGEIANILQLARSTVSNHCIRHSIEPAGSIAERKEYKLCPNCKELFIPSRRQKGYQQFCSGNCRGKYWYKKKCEKQAREATATTLQNGLDFLGKKSDEWDGDKASGPKSHSLATNETKGGINDS